MLTDEQAAQLIEDIQEVCNREVDVKEYPGVKVERRFNQIILVRLYGDVYDLEPDKEP